MRHLVGTLGLLDTCFVDLLRKSESDAVLAISTITMASRK